MKRKKSKKDTNSKNKPKIIILISMIIIVLCTASILIYNHQKEETIKDIKSHYSNNVIITKNTNLYNKNKSIYGKVSKGVTLSLQKIKIDSPKQKYFKVLDTDLYIYYKDAKKNNEKIVYDTNPYLVFNKNVETKNKTILYQDGKKKLVLNKKISLPLEYMDDTYYYVKYMNKMFQINKTSDATLVDEKNSEVKEAEYISVINYNTIGTCSQKTCVSVGNVEQQLNYLKEQGFYSITLDEYEKWLKGKIRLKEKAILLTTDNNNDEVVALNNKHSLHIQISNNTQLKFSDVNKKSTLTSSLDNIERYIVKKNTTIENFQKMTKGEDVVEVEPSTNISSEQKIAVLNYHFFYDPTLGESCNESICLDVSKFRQHLEYLKNNGYKTLKMEEFTKWMYGELELPEKSVLITVDDGAMGTGTHNGNKLIPLLEEYDLNATLFLISGWWDVGNYKYKNLDIQSHTYDMHQYGSCRKGQLVCATKEDALADLKKSLEIVDNNNSFCYPFYSYSDTAISAVKEAGFKIAFAGGNVKAKRSNDKYKIPRYPIQSSITMDEFIKIVS